MSTRKFKIAFAQATLMMGMLGAASVVQAAPSQAGKLVLSGKCVASNAAGTNFCCDSRESDSSILRLLEESKLDAQCRKEGKVLIRASNDAQGRSIDKCSFNRSGTKVDGTKLICAKAGPVSPGTPPPVQDIPVAAVQTPVTGMGAGAAGDATGGNPADCDCERDNANDPTLIARQIEMNLLGLPATAPAEPAPVAQAPVTAPAPEAQPAAELPPVARGGAVPASCEKIKNTPRYKDIEAAMLTAAEYGGHSKNADAAAEAAKGIAGEFDRKDIYRPLWMDNADQRLARQNLAVKACAEMASRLPGAAEAVTRTQVVTIREKMPNGMGGTLTSDLVRWVKPDEQNIRLAQEATIRPLFFSNSKGKPMDWEHEHDKEIKGTILRIEERATFSHQAIKDYQAKMGVDSDPAAAEGVEVGPEGRAIGLFRACLGHVDDRTLVKEERACAADFLKMKGVTKMTFELYQDGPAGPVEAR